MGIDFIAGPTEILILAKEGDPKLIAADMLAQAEHDVTASAMLFTTSESLANAVSAEIERQLETLPTASVARESINQSGAIAIFPNIDLAVAAANMQAPEHLSLHHPELLNKVTNAGTVFLGAHTPNPPAITLPVPVTFCPLTALPVFVADSPLRIL